MVWFKNIIYVILLVVAIFAFLPCNFMKDYSNPDALPIFIFRGAFSGLLRQAADWIQIPTFRVMDDIFGFARMEILYTCASLGIADVIGNGNVELDTLAKSVGVANSENLQRLLRAAESSGYFAEDLSTKKWHNTKFSSLLRRDHPSSLHYILLHFKEDVAESWSKITESIKSDIIAFEYTHGGDSFWDYLKKDSDQEEQFARAMTNVDSLGAEAQVQDYAWGDKNNERVLDIGGSLGSFLARILKANPHLKGVLFDRPEVIEKAKYVWSKTGKHSSLVDRVELVPGSFLDTKSIPEFRDGDIINMRVVLHDWTDDDVVKILKNIRGKIGSKRVTLALTEISLAPKDVVSTKFLLDLHMKIFFNAKERYISQWEELLNKAGFKLSNVNPTRSLNSIIVSHPVEIEDSKLKKIEL